MRPPRWELYDTVYTERYMGTPEGNPAGYNASSPLWRLDNLRDKQVMVSRLVPDCKCGHEVT